MFRASGISVGKSCGIGADMIRGIKGGMNISISENIGAGICMAFLLAFVLALMLHWLWHCSMQWHWVWIVLSYLSCDVQLAVA